MVLFYGFDESAVLAFWSALGSTAKVFLMGLAGFWLLRRSIVSMEILGGISAIIAHLTLPCLIIHRFAVQFDPTTFPFWWVMALFGVGLQLLQLGLGFLVSRRYSQTEGRDEIWYLLGFQNAGFFVLPMLQALLPARDFDRAAVWMFVFVIFFNATIFAAGNWILLKKRDFNPKFFLTLPPTLATVAALAVFGLFHHQIQPFRGTLGWNILFGAQENPGVIQLLGDLTVPLATLVLGGTIAQTAQNGLRGFSHRRAAVEINFWKLVALPFLGFLIIKFWPTPMFENDRVLRVLFMLEFAAPVAVQVSVFCAQHGYATQVVPSASLLSYAFCILSVPFWMALVL